MLRQQERQDVREHEVRPVKRLRVIEAGKKAPALTLTDQAGQKSR